MKFPSNTNASSSWLDPSEARANFRGSWNSARFFVENIFRELRSTRSLWQTANRPTERTRSGQRKRTLRSFFSVHLGLILLWIFTLWWGEKMTFKRTVADCAWARWENRPPEANPHHVILIADPQIVDPHTYPGRPWLLTWLTILHTDAYLRKSFEAIQSQLMPDTVLFLGDLFDGGREWSTPPTEAGESQSTDKRWHKYDDRYWLKEYNRFGKIYLEPWLRGIHERPSQRGRRLIAELPGNHDLGFGVGIRIPARKRFNAYFGEGNRVDMIGNFTFVSVDAVSLSANGQPDPLTGTQGADTGDEKVNKVWSPTETFLSGVRELKARVINRELRRQAGLSEMEPQDHTIRELDGLSQQEAAKSLDSSSSIPSILLTHVPLYRGPGTPCGQLREKYPPSISAQDEDGNIEKDMKNSLPVVAGVQFQTVLTPAISSEIIEKVGDIEAVFSGDDHDYCEVIHRGYTSRNGGIKEITLKAISWVAGVRKPGFLMLSLWNPIDSQGKRTSVGDNSADNEILKTHLCILPNQLLILKIYAVLLGVTLAILLAHSLIKIYGDSELQDAHNTHSMEAKKTSSMSLGPGTTSASVWSWPDGLATRNTAVGRARAADLENGHVNEKNNGYAMPGPGIKVSGLKDSYKAGSDTIYQDRGDWNEITRDDEPKRRTKKGLTAVLAQWRVSLQRVATVAMVWYLWLIWTT